MKTTITIILLLLCSAFSSVRAQDNFHQQADSLRKVLEESEGAEKLRTYGRLGILYYMQSYDNQKLDTLFSIYKEMNAEAIKQERFDFQANILFNVLGVHLNRREYDEVIRRAPEALEFTRKHELWNYHFQIYDSYIKAYLYKGDMETALVQTQELYQEAEQLQDNEAMAIALITMAKVYEAQHRSEGREENLRRAIDLLGEDNKLLGKQISARYMLCQTLMTKELFSEALEEARKLEEVNHRNEAFVGRPVISDWGNLWSIYVRLYVRTKDFDQAEIYCDKIDNLIDSPPFKIITYGARAEIFNHRKQYQRALEEADKGMNLIGDITSSEANQMRGRKIMILVNMSRGEEAAELFEEAVAVNDSIRNETFARQIDELHTQYNVAQITAEKERQRIIMIAALVGCLLLAVVVIIYIVYSRKLYKKNLSLYKQINERVRSDKEAEEAEAQIPVEQLSRERKLFLELQRLMNTEKLFTNSDLDRNKLAEQLGTNRQYLADAVARETGLTFGNYVADLRLKYSLELLSEQPDLTLEAVALDSGYGSYQPFFRAFQQKYGMNPSEYRKFAANKDVEKILSSS